MTTIRCITETRCLVAEGPLWHPEEKSLYWADINGMRVYRLDMRTGHEEFWQFAETVSAVCLTESAPWLLVACGMSVLRWNPLTDERIVMVEFPNEPKGNRLNDAAAGPDGTFWAGTMRNNVASDGGHIELDWGAAENRTGSLYCITPQREVLHRAIGLAIPNTLVWSPDGKTMVTGDSIDNVLRAYDYEPETLTERRVFTEGFERGVPDGSAMDALGFVWNCRYFGGCIVRFSPSGDVDRVVEMPVTNITNCVFGGKGLDTLYVTTAKVGAPDEEPLAGAIFAFEPGVAGLAPYRFG
jgi:sugar lactone lactonase YvrE